MIIELGNKKEKEYLHYKINNEEFNFYYKDTLLFQNNKNTPFLCLVYEKDGIKREIPLFNCEVRKQAENKFLIEFYNKNYRVKSRIILKNELINIYIVNKENSLIKMCLINREKNAVVGFGCNNVRNWQGKTIALFDREVQTEKEMIIEKKLCFYMNKKYLFYNKNIKDWRVNVDRDVNILTNQKEIFFALQVDGLQPIFEQAYAAKCQYRFIKNPQIMDLMQLKNYKGVILQSGNFEKDKYKINSKIYNKHGKKIIMEITPYFTPNNRVFNILSEQEKVLIYQNKDMQYYTYNFDNIITVRLIKNLIRGYLDTNIDGFYSVEKIVDKNNIYYQREYGKKWKALILEVFAEYPAKTLIYDKLEEKKIDGFYKIPLVKNMKNKDDFKHALICSGVYDIIFEQEKELFCY